MCGLKMNLGEVWRREELVFSIQNEFGLDFFIKDFIFMGLLLVN